MKKLLFILLIFTYSFSICAQNADKKIAESINSSDYFTLQKMYPLLKDSTSLFIQSITESFLNSYFNKPQKASASIQHFFGTQQGSINAQLATSMIYLWAENLKTTGSFKDGLELIDSYISNYPKEKQDNLRQYFEYLYHYCKAYQAFPTTKLSRPGKDISVTLTFKQTGERGESMYIPVKINNQVKQFIFDTGAGDNVVSEKFAHENHIKILDDSIRIVGIDTGYAKLGFKDSIQIGDMTYSNVSFLIVSEFTPNSTIKTDAVLGMPFIKLNNEIQIYPKEGKIVFPYKETISTDNESNIMCKDNSLYIDVKSENKKNLLMLFDTGNVSSTLTNRFLQNNKVTIKQKGIPDSLYIGGYGGIDTIPTYRLADQKFEMAQNLFSLKDIHVLTKDQLGNYANCDGVLGVNFIRLFDKITLNLNKMRIEILGNINNETYINKEFNLDFKPGKKYLIRSIHYDVFNPGKTAWEPTVKREFSKNSEKQKRQFDVTKRTSPKW